MSEKDQYHIPSRDKQGTAFQPGDEIDFVQASPDLKPWDVVEASRMAYEAASMSTFDAKETVVTPREAILQRGTIVSEKREQKSSGTLDLQRDDSNVVYIDRMHAEQAQSQDADDKHAA